MIPITADTKAVFGSGLTIIIIIEIIEVKDAEPNCCLETNYPQQMNSPSNKVITLHTLPLWVGREGVLLTPSTFPHTDRFKTTFAEIGLFMYFP